MKKTTNKDITSQSKAVKALQPLADALKVAVGELWGIFVRQYVVKGLSEAFTAIIFYTSAYFLAPHVTYFALIPLLVGIYFTYDAINLLGNPKYYALKDIENQVQKFKDGQ